MDVRRLVSAVAVIPAALLALSPSAVAALSNANDPYFKAGQQWALTGSAASINAPQAWCVGTGAGVLIGDIDSGADFGHPDLAGKLVPGVAFLNGNGQPSGSGVAAVSDDVGHGSMTTGLMVADTNNGAGIAGVAPDAKALIVKVLNAQGSGSDSDVGAGIRWAVDHGARVVNVSIGSDIPLTGDMTAMTNAIDYAYHHGAAVALAAGNNSLPLTDYQLSQIGSEALVVGALAPNGGVAYYSTNGVGVNIYAPGGDDSYGNNAHGLIVSTHMKGGYALEQGTSFAAPHAAGVLALLMGRGLNNVQARQRILDTANTGGGVPRLDAARAVGAGASCPKSTQRHATGSAAPLPVAKRVGAVATHAPASGSFTHSAPPAPSPFASAGVSGPDNTTTSPQPNAIAPIARSTPRSTSWALLAGAAAAVAIAAGFAIRLRVLR